MRVMHDGTACEQTKLRSPSSTTLTFRNFRTMKAERLQREQMLRIEIQSWNGVATLHCYGRVVFGVEAETLRAMVQSRPESNVRLSLAGVEKIDATGLGLLVELQNWATPHRKKSHLDGPVLTGLETGHPHQALRLAGDFLLRHTGRIRKRGVRPARDDRLVICSP